MICNACRYEATGETEQEYGTGGGFFVEMDTGRMICLGCLDDLGDCPTCGGSPVALGNLGQRVHARCRQCGQDWSARVETCPEEYSG